MREVVTVQVGGFANFVGAHFWNFQDELLGLADDPGADPTFKAAALDMDVLYRAGETHQGVSTYFPRLVSVGSRGSFGSLSSSGTLGLSSTAGDQLDVVTWASSLLWMIQEGFPQYLENIADDYTSTPVLIYCVRDPVTYVSSRNQRESITRSLHDAVSFSKLSSFCNLMVPIGLPSLSRSYLSPLLSIQDEKPFHSSAICAAAIHSVTVPFRLQNVGPASNLAHSSGKIDIGELVHILSDQGRQNMVIALDVAMPAPSLTGRNDPGKIQKNLHSLTPEISDEDEDPYSVVSLVVHGALDAAKEAKQPKPRTPRRLNLDNSKRVLQS